MGILESGILGPVRNKTGNTVTRMHKKINVVTGAYHKSAKPATAAQLTIQQKFGMLSTFLSGIDKLVRRGFKQNSKRKDPMNAAYTYNYGHAFVNDENGLRLNYPELVYSRGYITGAESPVLTALPHQIEVNWLPQRQSKYCQFTDMATIMIYNPAKKIFIKRMDITDRYAQGYRLELPKFFAGDTVHFYMSFASKDGKLQGNSTYLGELVCIG